MSASALTPSLPSSPARMSASPACGHMAPSLTAADGVPAPAAGTPSWPVRTILRLPVVQRNSGDFSWASQIQGKSAAARRAITPAVEALDSPYSKYPKPNDKYCPWLAGLLFLLERSNSTSLSSALTLITLSIWLMVRVGQENSSPNPVWQYQICAASPIPQATQITLTSPQRWMTLILAR